MHFSKSKNKNKNKNNSTKIFSTNKQLMIEEIKNDEMNNECFDCGCPNPEYISINNGIFLCKRCIYYHCKFPDEISTLIKNNLSSLGLKELNYLYFGGNRNLAEYISSTCPELNKYHPEILYKTDELKYYRDKLSKIINEDFQKDKLLLTQDNFKRPKAEQNYKYNNNTFNRNKMKNLNDIYDNNKEISKNKDNDNNKINLKKKYNYRKIPNKKKDEVYNSNYNSNSTSSQNTNREKANKKQYKKRFIPSDYHSNAYKISSNTYHNQTESYNPNRLYIDTNGISNDSYLLSVKI